MATTTLEDLRARVREACQMEASDFIGDAELDAIINSEAAELHLEVVTAAEDALTTSQVVSVSSGNTIALSSLSNFLAFRGLDRDEGGEYREVTKADWHQRNRRAAANWARTVRYRLVGPNIFLTPDDAAVGTYRVWYVPAYARLSLPADVLTLPHAGADDMIVHGAAARCFSKEGDDAAAGLRLQLKAAAREQLRRMLALRDLDAPEPVARVRTRSSGWGDDDE